MYVDGNRLTPQSLEAYVYSLEASLRRLSQGTHSERGVVLEGHGTFGLFTATARRRLAQTVRQYAHEAEKHVVGTAVITESSIFRGVVTAMGWLSPLSIPLSCFAHIDLGLQWLATRKPDLAVADVLAELTEVKLWAERHWDTGQSSGVCSS